MNIFVTYNEGGQWHQLAILYVADTINLPNVAAVRYGDWIYDFQLKRMGLNPIRLHYDKHGD